MKLNVFFVFFSLIGRLLVRDPSKRASLTSIEEDQWVRVGDCGHAEHLPLISKEQLTEEAHDHILEQMITGGIVAHAEELLK